MEVQQLYHTVRHLEIKIEDCKNAIIKTDDIILKRAWKTIQDDYQASLDKKKTEMLNLISSLVNPK